MTKYKLIKVYPGSPKLGEIRTGSEENCRCYPTEKCMENNPEFWEKVEELCVPVGTKFIHSDDYGFIYTISSIDNKTCTVSWVLNNTQCNIGYHISFVNKLFKEGTWIEYKEPEVLFTTEDGVDVVDSEQTVYFVDNYFSFYKKKAINASNRIKNNCTYKYFSTEKAAKNYIKCNKPVLSYKEVLNLYDENWVRPDRDKFKSQLTKLVKSKL